MLLKEITKSSKKRKIRIYIDSCVYNRPFDYQGQERVALETEIFIYILEKIENKFYELITSEALLYENMKDSDMERKEWVFSYFELSNKFIEIADKDIYRGRFLQEKGFSGIDSLHIALAEKARADYFITCDDGIIKLYKKYKKLINIEVLSLVEFIGRIK